MLRVVLGVLLLLAGVSLAWFSLKPEGGQSIAAAAPVTTIKILVTAEPLQAGTLLKDTDFKERDVSAAEASASDFVADENDRTELRGAMLRRYVEVGQVIHRADILRPRDRGFLASVLSPGTRAVSIGVDATTGASGLISPGDLVDVILTQEFARGETTAGRRVVAETVLNKVRVIAVDQQITQGAPTSQSVGPAQSSRIASNVSLEVTPEQAGKVVVAGRLGRLTLTVRSADSDQVADAIGSTRPNSIGDKPASISVFGSDVSNALSNEQPAASPRLRVIQGDAMSDVVFR